MPEPIPPKSILFVHQGFDLYGSDRTLIQSVQAAKARWPEARITVLLPGDGALRPALEAVVIDVRVEDLGILRKSDLKRMKLGGPGSFIRKILKARQMIRSHDITYINTVIVMDYILAAGLTRRPRVVHAHEIPTGIARIFFSAVLTFSRAFLIFNSDATRRSFLFPFWQRSAVIWNGVAAWPQLPQRQAHADLNLLLIGRFNSWKGQSVLILAIAGLSPQMQRRVRVRLVGGVFGDQQHFADDVKRLVDENSLFNVVEMVPFTDDPFPHYEWADVVVVPSIKPEPFGLVAIEGMAARCCVIGANHGGLAEIVVDGVTGTLVTPGSVESLKSAIERYMEDPAVAVAQGIAGKRRFEEQFEESHYKTKIADVMARLQCC
jgi:glycosyltransferase involved in cell wall biosynthesis